MENFLEIAKHIYPTEIPLEQTDNDSLHDTFLDLDITVVNNTFCAPRSIETLVEAILNLSGQIDLPITLETSHYLFNNYGFIAVFKTMP